jgi:hypothetical protein
MRKTAHSFRKSTAQRRPRSPQKIRIPWFFFSRHLEVEPIGLKRFSPVEGIDQRLDTEKQAAGSPCRLVTLIGLHQGFSADMLHDIKR